MCVCVSPRAAPTCRARSHESARNLGYGGVCVRVCTCVSVCGGGGGVGWWVQYETYMHTGRDDETNAERNELIIGTELSHHCTVV